MVLNRNREFLHRCLVRCNAGQMYLLDYSRTMNQIFNGNKQVIDKDGIMLGVTNSDVAYATNKKGTIVAFVQERDLWLYNTNNIQVSSLYM